MTCGMTIGRGTRYARVTLKADSVYAWCQHIECSEIGRRSIDGYHSDEGYTLDTVTDWLLDVGEAAAIGALTADDTKNRVRAWFAERAEKGVERG